VVKARNEASCSAFLRAGFTEAPNVSGEYKSFYCDPAKVKTMKS
jgi:hypothetical protein